MAKCNQLTPLPFKGLSQSSWLLVYTKTSSHLLTYVLT